MDSNAQANLWNQWYASIQNQMNSVASQDNRNGNNSSEKDEADRSSTSLDTRSKPGPSNANSPQNAAPTTELTPQQGQHGFQVPFVAPVPMPNLWGNPGFGFVPSVPYPFNINSQNPVMMPLPNASPKNSEGDQMKNNGDPDNDRTTSRERSRSSLRDRNDSDTSDTNRTIERVGRSSDRNQPDDKSPQRSKTPDQIESNDGNIQQNSGQMMGFNPIQGFQYPFMAPVFSPNCWNQGFGFVTPPFANNNMFTFSNGNRAVPGNSNIESQRIGDQSVKKDEESRDPFLQSPTADRKSQEDKYPLEQEELVKKQQHTESSSNQNPENSDVMARIDSNITQAFVRNYIIPQLPSSEVQPSSNQSAVDAAPYTSFRTELMQSNLQQPAPQAMTFNMFPTYQFPAAWQHFNMLNRESAPIQINFTNAAVNITEKAISDIQKEVSSENSNSNIQHSVLPKNDNMVPLDKAPETAPPDGDVYEIRSQSTESIVEVFDNSDTDDKPGDDPSSDVPILSCDNFKILPPLPEFRTTQPVVIPSGCNTIRIEGLSDDLSKTEIREIFVRYGSIVSITIMENFCLLRYKEEQSLEAAIGLSGHRLLVNGLEKEHTLSISYERTTRNGVPWTFNQIIERRTDAVPQNASPVGNREQPNTENVKIEHPCEEGERGPADLSGDAGRDKAPETAPPDGDVYEIRSQSTESIVEVVDDSDPDDKPGDDPSSDVPILVCDNFKILPPLPEFRNTQPVVIPSGCNTIRIEGLSDDLSKTEIREIFVRYGSIVSITIMENFCFLRYKEEQSLEAAIGLSGHRLLVSGLKKEHTLNISYERTTRNGVPWTFNQIIERRTDAVPQNASPVGNRERPNTENVKIEHPCEVGEGGPADLSEDAEGDSRRITRREVDRLQFLLSSYPLRLFKKNKRLPRTKTTIKLLPPHPRTPPPFVSAKPPGCRTVCIEGIWQNFKWECVHFMFESFGNIVSFDVEKDRGLSAFTVRYKEDKGADKAVSLSGYRLVADQKNWSGKREMCILIVDYVSNPKDQNEWKKMQEISQACLKEHSVENRFKTQQIASNSINNANTHPKENVSQLLMSPNKSTVKAGQNTLPTNQDRPPTQVEQEAIAITHNKPLGNDKSGNEGNTKCVIRSAVTKSMVEIPDSDPIVDPNPSENVEIIAYPGFKLLPPLRECRIPKPLPKPVDCNTIQIEGLNHNFTMNDIYLIFAKYGTITKIEIMKNFCIVQYKDKEKTGAALALSGYRLQNNESENTHTMFINFYDPAKNERGAGAEKSPPERKRAAGAAAEAGPAKRRGAAGGGGPRGEPDPQWEASATGVSSMRVQLPDEVASSRAVLQRLGAANADLAVESWRVLFVRCLAPPSPAGRPALQLTLAVADADRRRIASRGLFYPPLGRLESVIFPMRRAERKRRLRALGVIP